MSYLDKAKDMYAMSANGKMLEAFEKYYHNDVVMEEASGEVRKGKMVNLEFQKKFVEGVKEIHGFTVKSVTSNEAEAITMVESLFDATMLDGSRAKMEEVAVQHWQGDLIIHERFYYNVENH